MNRLRAKGKLVWRTSGSVGAHDLMVVSKKTHKVEMLIQAKSLKSKVYYFDKRAIYEWTRLFEIFKETGIKSVFWFGFRRGAGKKIREVVIEVKSPTPPKKVICPQNQKL